ncbi:tripartite tricarboxylate transporter substrate binding protein [Shumkonia mesophila]|uniref:tripartite tricarboxylate transporter substrate binding protein n=1 Tax=Shumkonia mesophila TaxID=2838854 RepID=UPI002934D2AA|nr:tripartite tricarboxylate transporter substrate binding protein [Shumkonia mesophila]
MKKSTLLTGMAALLLALPSAAQEYPAKDRTITMIMPSSPGGGADTAARLFAPLMEKDLGVPIELINKPGASMQIGVSEALRAKPDGYTIFWSILPTQASIYLDPERKATFGRKDIQTIGNAYGAPFAVSVLATSPYQTIQDVIAAAKAKPKEVRSGTTGFMSTGHFANIEFQRAVGVEMATVNFQGGGPQITALLGGHIGVAFNSIGELLTHQKAGTIRVLAVMDDERSDFLPGVKTLKELGINAKPIGSFVGLAAPAGVSKEVIKVLSDSLRKATQDPHAKERMDTLGNTIQYLDAQGYDAFWTNFDENLKPLIAIAKEQSK